MFVRVTSSRGEPSQQAANTEYFKNSIAPKLLAQPGCFGVTMVVDPTAGEATSSTWWESLEALNAAEQMATQIRQQGSREMSIQITDVDRFEIVAFDRRETSARRFARINELYAAPGKIDQAAELLGGKVLSTVRQLPGFVAGTGGVNRFTGRCFFVSSWDSPESRAASESGVTGLRDEVARVIGSSGVLVKEAEVVYAEMKTPATA